MAAPAKTYTLEELKKHKTTDDLWIAIQGRVYNITAFLEEHPGGDGVLVDNAGKHPSPHRVWLSNGAGGDQSIVHEL
jgi:cytochrome b involved in lipid metabolism